MAEEADQEVPPSAMAGSCECICPKWTASNTRAALGRMIETIDWLAEEPGMLKDEAYRQLMTETKSLYQGLVADERSVTGEEDSDDEDDDVGGVSDHEFERVMAGAEALFGNSESVSQITGMLHTMMRDAAADDEQPAPASAPTRAPLPAPANEWTWNDDMRTHAYRVDASFDLRRRHIDTYGEICPRSPNVHVDANGRDAASDED
jgi:hypothetical protein